MNKFEEALRQARNGSGAGSDVSRSTAGGGSGGGGPPGLSFSSRFQDFTPTYIELKGWVTNWSDHGARAEQLLTWSDCQKLIDNCLERCNQLEKDAVDREATERINSGRYMFGSVKISFKPNTSRDLLWTIKKKWDAITRNTVDGHNGLPLPAVLTEGLAIQFPGSNLRVQIECAPWKRDHVKAVARFCGAFRTMTQQHAQIEVRGEIGPPRSLIWTVAKGALRPINIATFTSARNTWEVHEPQWQQVVSAFPAVVAVTKQMLESEVNRRQ